MVKGELQGAYGVNDIPITSQTKRSQFSAGAFLVRKRNSRIPRGGGFELNKLRRAFRFSPLIRFLVFLLPQFFLFLPVSRLIVHSISATIVLPVATCSDRRSSFEGINFI